MFSLVGLSPENFSSIALPPENSMPNFNPNTTKEIMEVIIKMLEKM
jgi:hypothetical protein